MNIFKILILTLGLMSCGQTIKVKGGTTNTANATGRVDVVQSGSSTTEVVYKIDFSVCSEIKRAIDSQNVDDPAPGTAAEAQCLTTLVDLLSKIK